MPKIAIIGAGLSGLVLAKELGDKAQTTIFEKARGAGGRMSTRYAGDFEFDHGAQYFTVRSHEFAAFLKPLIAREIVQEWKPRTVTLSRSEKSYKRDWFEAHHVASPRMNSLCKSLSENADLQLNSQVTLISGYAGNWQVNLSNQEVSKNFQWVISTAPAPQSCQLMPQEFSELIKLSEIKMQACFALMLGFNRELPLKFDAAKVKDSPIGWISVNSSKPGRSGAYTLLVQSTNQWAEENIEEPSDRVQEVLIEELSALLEIELPTAEYQSLHRWRFANTNNESSGREFYLDVGNQLAACGDWCLGGRVENAFLSAYALSHKIKTFL
ncbi:MAG: FAD-dependent oxidoreductase [Candidatus Caenarcaniphilales bacterium]|nr:FAD-dependent oxidoreductase [Candidatus Caenarcaniphilales bacterium]